MDFARTLYDFAAYQLVTDSFFEEDPVSGLPCIFLYCRVIQLLIRVWSGCFGVANEVGLKETECKALFRSFQSGGVPRNEELQKVLGLAFVYCTRNPVSESGWATLSEFFKFASQQGRLEQPWGVYHYKWIKSHRLCSLYEKDVGELE